MTETCRICLEASTINALIAPCECKGSQKYVHAKCLGNWQATTVENFLSSPTRLSLVNMATCSVCHSPYKTKQEASNRIHFSPYLELVWDQTWKLRYGTFAVSICLLFIISWYWVLLLLLFSGIFVCYWTSMRPTICKTLQGYRVSLIRMGKPLSNFRSGVLIKATEQISKGIFKNSLVLITEYSMQKAIGFIINKEIRKE